MAKTHVIDLTPDEAGVLSLVAEHAGKPDAEADLVEVLGTSTPRAKAIGDIILKRSDRPKPAYKVVAERFRSAAESNEKGWRLLRASNPQRREL